MLAMLATLTPMEPTPMPTLPLLLLLTLVSMARTSLNASACLQHPGLLTAWSLSADILQSLGHKLLKKVFIFSKSYQNNQKLQS